MNLKQKIARKIKRVFSPVCQNPAAVIYGENKGETVLLVPVLSPCDPTMIERWVPDPEAVVIVKKRNEGRNEHA